MEFQPSKGETMGQKGLGKKMREQQEPYGAQHQREEDGGLWGSKRRQRVSGKAVKCDLQMRNMKDHG